MPRYYCDYCDTYLTHDSPSVRKQHNAGYKHKANVRTYYQQFEEQQTQSLIDQKIKEHLGQAAVQYQVGAAFNQFLQANPQRPRPPILPLPMGAPQMPIGSPFVPGIRPPVLPPPGTTSYGAAPTVPPSMAPPIAPSMPMQVNNLPGPPMVNPPVPGATTAPTPNSAMNTVTYQANPSFTSGSSTAPAGSTNSQETFAYSQNS
ncbi:uncharacterized protein A4U43_C08F14810 [Asparagus officinalis]|uniref:U1 small nuclear ribonucleoprotein C-like n=1 Tax=Asparagus officinalis TaxID=4686 RepID=UPI00098E2BD8|nr:U1 small nuclear ribonucleoprotein C-like [Asparagus officinalis]ONK60140.1 uncharacterized protein A4U43_C08F14810 [Asparagus officinalis]